MASHRAPSGLDTAGKRLWRSLMAPDWEWDPDELRVLEDAARTADVVAALEAQTRELDSLTTVNGAGTPIAHPAVIELRLQRGLLSSLLGRLRIPIEDEESGWDGLSSTQRARKAAHARWGRNSA